MAKKGKRGKQKPPAATSPGPIEHAAAGFAPLPGEVPSSVEVSMPGSATAQAVAASGPVAAPISRALANALILVFLAYQIAMPLRYYLGGRGYDERFSWRMFSTLRMQKCRAQVIETVEGVQSAVNLRKEIQVAWIGMLERYRRPVIDKLLARRCAAAGASQVVFTRSCTDTDGSALPDTTVSLECASGVLVVDEEASP